MEGWCLPFVLVDVLWEFCLLLVEFQWFLTPFSVLPGILFAISTHLQPTFLWATTNNLSSSSLHLPFCKHVRRAFIDTYLRRKDGSENKEGMQCMGLCERGYTILEYFRCNIYTYIYMTCNARRKRRMKYIEVVTLMFGRR